LLLRVLLNDNSSSAIIASELPGKPSSVARVMGHKRLFMSGEKDGLPTAQNPGLDAQREIRIEANGTDLPSEHERKILQEQIDVPVVKTTYTALYRYATDVDTIVIVVSTV